MSLTKTTYSMINGASVNVLDFGADPTGTNDSTSSIQSAINSVVSTGKQGSVYLPSGTYKITSTLTVNSSYVSIKGESAVLNCAAIVSGAALVINASIYPPYTNLTIISGIELLGNSSAGIVTGIQFSGTTDVSHILLDTCNISNFGIGESFETNSYLISHNNVTIWNCKVGVQNLTGFVNNGENISFVGGSLFGNGTNISITNGGGDMNFTNVSIDNPATAQISITNGELHFVNCHIECGGATPVFSNNVTNSITSFSNCLFIQQVSTGTTPFMTINGAVDITNGRFAMNAGTSPVIQVNAGGTLNLVCSFIEYTGSQFFNLVSGSTYTITLPYAMTINGTSATNFISNNSVSSLFISSSGTFLGGLQVVLSSLNTLVSLGVGTTNGLFIFRDTTSGGTAAFIADTTGGAHSIYNGITGFNMIYNGVSGQMSVEITSGTTPRNLLFTILQTGA